MSSSAEAQPSYEGVEPSIDEAAKSSQALLNTGVGHFPNCACSRRAESSHRHLWPTNRILHRSSMEVKPLSFITVKTEKSITSSARLNLLLQTTTLYHAELLLGAGLPKVINADLQRQW